MRLLRPRLAMAMALSVALAGCNKDQPAGDTTTALEPSTPAAAVEAPKGPVYLTPATLDSCTQGAIVVVHWDMKASHPEVSDVEIYTGPPGKQTLFAAGGYAGEASTTQPWAYPGTTFSVRNKTDGTELATATVGGPACPAM